MEIVKSQNDNYYVKDQSAISDFTYYQKARLAEKYGRSNITQKGFVTFPNKCDCEQFADCLELIARIPSDLKEFLKNWGAYFPFCYNLNGGDPSTISTAFVWGSTSQGNTYWSNLSKKYDENQLQNTGTDRSRDNRSERNRLRSGGDIVESSTRYSGYEARARKSKNAFRSHKVYLSSRCGCVHRG